MITETQFRMLKKHFNKRISSFNKRDISAAILRVISKDDLITVGLATGLTFTAIILLSAVLYSLRYFMI